MSKKAIGLTFILTYLFILNANAFQFLQHYTIIANTPHLDVPKLSTESTILIALDGAANKLKKAGIKPNIILGDFDSIEEHDHWGIQEGFHDIHGESEPYTTAEGILIIPAKDQNYTDLEKAILYADSQEAKSISIYNAFGGRLDHSLGNLRLLKKYYKTDRPIHLIDTHQTAEYHENKTLILNGKTKSPIGIFAFPKKAKITTKGLAWDVKDYELIFAEQESIANQFEQETAEIAIKGGVLIVH
jgi:thiamine pyrophosphokinase